MAIAPLSAAEDTAAAAPASLDLVFAALADPVRRDILERLGEEEMPIVDLARPYGMSTQAVWKHVQVLVRAGLVRQERAGRISRCSLDAGPIFEAAVWLNRYAKYWQQQFETMALWLGELETPPKEPAQPVEQQPNRRRDPQ
jgi:DNA-binding transcriptional ArsR family regulator